eukprot:g1528.t1
MCVGLALSMRPSAEMLKLMNEKKGLVACVEPLPHDELLRAPYLCEGCRVVMEEVEFQLQEEIAQRTRKGEKPGMLDPRKLLRWICNFTPKQPRRFRARMDGMSAAYRGFCAATMKDPERRQALVDTIAGPRDGDPLHAVRQFCVHRLGLCPAARYREPTDPCDACRKLMRDMDEMLSRTPWENVTAELAAEHIEYQCETLKHRFVGAHRPSNLLEAVCEDLAEGQDDAMLSAALAKPAERRRRLVSLCAERCEGGSSAKARQRKMPKQKKRRGQSESKRKGKRKGKRQRRNKGKRMHTHKGTRTSSKSKSKKSTSTKPDRPITPTDEL